MKNRRLFSLVAIALLCAMLMPFMASCTKEAIFTVTEVPVYTIYSIKDPDTTDEAIMQTELALNRLLFYRRGICVKLCLYTEDEYENAIKEKFAEIEAYNEEQKNNKKDKNSKSPSDEVSKTVRTGDDLIKDLENGIEIELNKPRLDIFLVRGYDNYLSYINDKALAALDEKLAGDAKAIKTFVHPSFLSAAKIDGKTYGVPCNSAIGEYEYIVFDKELLQKYNYDSKTMGNLEDLQEYLAKVQEGEEDIIPLLNASESNLHNFMFNDGYPTLLDSTKHVISAYEDESLLKYYAMIARYNASGYFESKSGLTSENKDARFAVAFMKGNQETIDDLVKETGREYECNVYKNPVATNDNTINNILCVSKFCSTNELTDAAKLLKDIMTDPDIQNILTYGVEKVNYILDDNKQVKLLDNKDHYRIDREYTGNPFIAYTMAGEPTSKWEIAKQQNLDSKASGTLGFSLSLSKFSYKEDGKTINITEPDYHAIMKEVVAKYYPELIKGNAFEFDLASLTESATENIYNAIKDDIKREYESTHQAAIKAEILASIENSSEADELYKQARETMLDSIRGAAKKTLNTQLLKELKSKYEAEGISKTSAEIKAEADAILTDEYIDAHLTDVYSEEKIQGYIDNAYQDALNAAVTKKLNEKLESSEYKASIEKYLASEEYAAEVEDRFEKSGIEQLNNEIDSQLSENVKEVVDTIIEELNAEIKKAIDEFIAEYAEKLEKSKDEILVSIGFQKGEKPLKDDGTVDDKAPTVYTEIYDSYFEFVWQGKIKTQYYKLFGDPDQPK